MPKYGNPSEPGIVSNVSSSVGVATDNESPSTLGIVGQPDLGGSADQGNADINTLYEVVSGTEARDLFGEDSLLTQGILDSFNEGAFPVYAVAPKTISVTAEDHSTVGSTNVPLDYAPLKEDGETIGVSLDGSNLTVNLVYDDVSSYSPEAGECFLNPVRGTLEIPTTPASSLDVDYHYLDYGPALDEMVVEAEDVVDILAVISENSSVVNDALNKVETAPGYALMSVKAGADIYISDASSFSQSYDSSRLQIVYGTRFGDGSSMVAPYAAKKSSLGLERTAIKTRLTTDRKVHPKQRSVLDSTGRADLIEANVTPIQPRGGRPLIVDDVNTVKDGNPEEQGLRFGYNRLAMDYIIDVVRQNETAFVGLNNRPEVRTSLQGVVDQELESLRKTGPVIDYSLNIRRSSPTETIAEINVDLADPLRNIRNNYVISNSV